MNKSKLESSLIEENVLISRYGKQTILPEVGIEGQRKLLAGSVAIIGLGGLGSTCGQFLASAGIGKITAIDHDVVQINNIHRQPLYYTRDCDRPKSSVFSTRLAAINPSIKIIPFIEYFDDDNAEELVGDSPILIDGSDNFPTRYAINRFCIKHNRIMVSSAIRHNSSSFSIFKPNKNLENACYACAFPFESTAGIRNDCNDIGLLGPIAGLAGCYQAMKVINLLLGNNYNDFGRLTISEWKTNYHYTIKVNRNKNCLMCGNPKTISS